MSSKKLMYLWFKLEAREHPLKKIVESFLNNSKYGKELKSVNKETKSYTSVYQFQDFKCRRGLFET
jgi:hypothetical protein